MSLLVRSWEPTDAAATLEVFRRSVHVSAAADYSAAQRAAWAPEDLEAQEWGRRRAAAGTRVAVHDDSIAGFTDLSPQGHIGMFYVHPEHGRRGVGTALLAVLLREAAARGVQRVTVDASLTARGFFERAGFTTVREQRVQRGGQEFTNVAMQLVLPEPGDRQSRHSVIDEPGGDSGGGDSGGQDDEAVLQRAAARRRAGWALLEQLRVVELLSVLGPVRTMGSVVSGLVVARDLDVAVRVGAGFTPVEVVALLTDLVRLPGVEGFDLADERGERTPFEQRDERYHVCVRVRAADGELWTLDLSLFLHDEHAHVAEQHERWREQLSDAQRAAVLRVKEQWHRRPDYPGGWAVCRAVLEGGARSRQQAEQWLAAHA